MGLLKITMWKKRIIWLLKFWNNGSQNYYHLLKVPIFQP